MNAERIVVLGQAGFVPTIPLSEKDMSILNVIEAKKIYYPNPALLHMLRQTVLQKIKTDDIAVRNAIIIGLCEDRKIASTLGFGSLYAKILAHLNIQPANPELAFALVRIAFEDWEETKSEFGNLDKARAMTMIDSVAQAARKFLEPTPSPSSRLVMNLRKFILRPTGTLATRTPVFTAPPPSVHILEIAGVEEVIEKIKELSPRRLERERQYVESFYREKPPVPIRQFDTVDLLIHRMGGKPPIPPAPPIGGAGDLSPAGGAGGLPPAPLAWREDKTVLETALSMVRAGSKDKKVLYVMEECLMAQGRNIRRWRG